MSKFLMLLLSACLIANSFAADTKEWTEEEVKKAVQESMQYRYSASGLDLSLPEEYKAKYRTDYNELPSGMNKDSVMYRSGKSYFIPFDIENGDIWKIAVASTAAVIFFANDQEVMDFQQSHKTDITKQVAFFGEGFGSEWPMYAAAGGYILGVITKNDGTKRYALMGAKAMLISGITAQALKNVFHRERPSGDNGAYNFEGLDGKFGSNVSFPSGHTTLAFSAATYIAETNKHRGPLIPIMAYSVAALSAWSRVHDKAHWGSDVVIGALVGHLVTKAVLNSKSAERGFVITPSVDLNGTFYVSMIYSGRPKKASSNCGKGIEDQREKIRVCIAAAFEDSGL